MVNFPILAATLTLPLAAIAHPGENVQAIKREMAQRSEQHTYASRALSQCANTPQALALKARTAERRAAKAVELREKRGLTNSMAPLCWPLCRRYTYKCDGNRSLTHVVQKSP